MYTHVLYIYIYMCIYIYIYSIMILMSFSHGAVDAHHDEEDEEGVDDPGNRPGGNINMYM